jgi:hypothetical protein
MHVPGGKIGSPIRAVLHVIEKKKTMEMKKDVRERHRVKRKLRASKVN